MAVRPINGVYFANQLENIDYFQNPPTSRDSKTVVTFNLGGEWEELDPPTDKFSNPIPCEAERCGLQLHLSQKNKLNDITYFGPLYSNVNAVGLLLGTGNMGKYMESDLSTVKTYLSRNAGWSWMEIRNGSHLYEFADHGFKYLSYLQKKKFNLF